MRICEFDGKKVAIWGLGKEGWSTLRVLRKYLPNADLTVLNDTPLLADSLLQVTRKMQIPVLIGDEAAQALATFDVIVKSPGISLYRKEIKEVMARVNFTSATRIWFAERPSEKTVCITGTKGKSTTTALTAHLITHLGLQVGLGGNIGIPILDLLETAGNDVWIMELSSYQTSDFDGCPDIAVLLNLFPEHLDWHGSVENYFRDKLNLLSRSPRRATIVNYQDRETRRFHKDWPNLVYFNAPEAIHFDAGYIRQGRDKLLPVRDIRLPGGHNISNVCAALTVIHCLGMDVSQCLPALSSFQGLPHRLYPLGERDGIFYVDDSISTTPQSAMAAVEAYGNRPLVILVGGFDRGLNWGELAHFLVEKSVYAIITMPTSGDKIADALRETLPVSRSPIIHQTVNLEEAVQVARSITPEGGVVLLSPAAPSYGSFRNFQERGYAFSRLAGFA